MILSISVLGGSSRAELVDLIAAAVDACPDTPEARGQQSDALLACLDTLLQNQSHGQAAKILARYRPRRRRR